MTFQNVRKTDQLAMRGVGCFHRVLETATGGKSAAGARTVPRRRNSSDGPSTGFSIFGA